MDNVTEDVKRDVISCDCCSGELTYYKGYLEKENHSENCDQKQ